jgi:hypothetical protein
MPSTEAMGAGRARVLGNRTDGAKSTSREHNTHR